MYRQAIHIFNVSRFCMGDELSQSLSGPLVPDH